MVSLRFVVRCLLCGLLLLVMLPRAAAAHATRLTLTSDPPGAQVREDDSQSTQVLGTTPLTFTLQAPYMSHRFMLSLAGYEPFAVAVDRLPPGAPETHLQRSALLSPATPLTWMTWSWRHHPWPSTAAAVVLAALVGAGALSALRRARRPSLPVLDPADSFAGYRRVRLLGEGAFSRVYEVQSEGNGAHFALKLLKHDVLEPNAAERFMRESDIANRLDHPCVVKVYDVGQHNGTWFMVMDLLAGRTLEDRLEEGPLPLGEALDIFTKMCQGLWAAHQRDIVHRDLKPANVMLEPDGGVRLLDFGLARCVDKQKLTATGSCLGTPFYMSPEQVRNAKAVDERSDIYSLGCILYEMLSGKPVFDGTDAMAVILAHATQPAPRLRAICPHVPARIDAMIARMLDKRPAQRYQNVLELLKQLRGAGCTV
jgi:tRNA A-37 threonylcarbamoyl transferase component Bud32